MCQNIAVKTVVDDFVSKGFMFTAFDVTKLLRAGGQSVRHSDVNDAVKQMYRDGEMNGYLRDTKDVGAPVAPFVYYHQNADLSNYVTDWLENNPNQDGMKNDGDNDDGSGAGISQPTPSTYGATSIPSITTSSISSSLPKGAKNTDREGRLYINPVIVQQAGFRAKQKVDVTYDIDRIIVARLDGTKVSSHVVSVNSDGRIRICPTILRNLSPAKGYRVCANKDVIEVVSVK